MDGKYTIYYNDTPGTVSKVIGFITKEDTCYVYIKANRGNLRIPIVKIIRIEEGEK